MRQEDREETSRELDEQGPDSFPSTAEEAGESEGDHLRDLQARRREALRSVEEAGGGEQEGFELAEEELIEHASHGDQHSTFPIFRDAEDENEDYDADVYGEADEERKRD